MSKLLSMEETKFISAKMTDAYGLPPPTIANDSYYGSATWGVKVEIVRPVRVRVFDGLPWPTRLVNAKVKDFYATDFENALVNLQQELSRFDSRAKTAEQFREKYALQEADKALDEVLREK